MKLSRRTAFSALVTPAGIHVVEYHHVGGGLRVARYLRDLTPDRTAEEAADALGTLLESAGGRQRRLSLCVSGFGSCHQIIALPPASDEVLRPVVAREMRRFYPHLFQDERKPVLEFVEIDSAGSAATAPARELLVAGLPRSLVDTFADTLAERGVVLDHWTILPRAMQRLYEAFADVPGTHAVLLQVPGAPLLGLFHDGELRLFSEPMSGPGGPVEHETQAEVVAEQLERGALYVRQQFRGATVDRVLIAADPDADLESLRAHVQLPVTPFGPLADEPGSVAALGAALDAGRDGSLNLLPEGRRPVSDADRWSRRLGVASAVVLAAAGLWWGWSASRVEARAEARLAAVESSLSGSGQALSRARPIVDQRQAHAQRALLLQHLVQQRYRLPEVLWSLQSAAPVIQVRDLQVRREDRGWNVVVTGRSSAANNALATDAVEGLVRQIATELPDGAVSLDQLAYEAAPDSTAAGALQPIAVAFRLSFIVPAAQDAAP